MVCASDSIEISPFVSVGGAMLTDAALLRGMFAALGFIPSPLFAVDCFFLDKIGTPSDSIQTAWNRVCRFAIER